MSKFQPPMLNDDVCRAATDKQTHKHTHKHTYRVKTEETFFTAKFFIVYFSFSISLKVKKKNSKRDNKHTLSTHITQRSGIRRDDGGRRKRKHVRHTPLLWVAGLLCGLNVLRL